MQHFRKFNRNGMRFFQIYSFKRQDILQICFKNIAFQQLWVIFLLKSTFIRSSLVMMMIMVVMMMIVMFMMMMVVVVMLMMVVVVMMMMVVIMMLVMVMVMVMMIMVMMIVVIVMMMSCPFRRYRICRWY